MRYLLAAALAATVSFPAHAAVDCTAQRQPRSAAGVIATENVWVKALTTRDGKALSCILAPGFMDMAWDGKLNSRAEVLARLPKRPNNGIKLSHVKVTLAGNRAIARGVNMATKPDGRLIGRVKFEDIFQYRDGMWRALTAQEVLMR
ncbi:MAG: nuclear transport factor 2 family protein [Proteobacteria bacterium]|nr:nuclear transport factor 2 family protein [Pseudomonadota bacterium]